MTSTPRLPERPIFILGVNSIIGWSIARHACQVLGRERVTLFCNPRTRVPARMPWRRLDMDDRDGLADLVARERPPLIIHCAGICKVETCETSPEFAQVVNVRSMDHLTQVVPAHTRVVYVSSDHVFSGDSGPYTESSPPDPLSEYGRTRVAAEALLRTRHEDALIVRASLWIGPSYNGRIGHLDWLRYRTARGLPMTVVADEHRSAAWAQDAAARTLDLSLSPIRGIRHVVAERAIARPVLAGYLDRRFAIGARFSTTTRAARRMPHLGQVTLETGYQGPLAHPLPSVVPLRS